MTLQVSIYLSDASELLEDLSQIFRTCLLVEAGNQDRGRDCREYAVEALLIIDDILDGVQLKLWGKIETIGRHFLSFDIVGNCLKSEFVFFAAFRSKKSSEIKTFINLEVLNCWTSQSGGGGMMTKLLGFFWKGDSAIFKEDEELKCPGQHKST